VNTSTRRKVKLVLIASTIAGAFILHIALPVGSRSWHWAHLLAQELFFIPILLSAAWFDRWATVSTTVAVSLLSVVHSLLSWRGFPLVQADQLAAIVSFWIAAAVASLLFERSRRAERDARTAHEGVLDALARSLELRERQTEHHSERVRAYSLVLANRLGIRDREALEVLSFGAFLHDIGKIGIPDSILLKAGPLTEEEWEKMREHPEIGARLIGELRFLAAAREMVLSHHERYDGAGYPKGLKGKEIPLGARLFAVADTLDAVTTDRPYRRGRSFSVAAGIIRSERGRQFDPAVVEAFAAIPFEAWLTTAMSFGVTLTP